MKIQFMTKAAFIYFFCYSKLKFEYFGLQVNFKNIDLFCFILEFQILNLFWSFIKQFFSEQ